MAECERRLQVDEVRDREQRGVDPVVGEGAREGGLGGDYRVPGAGGVQPCEDRLGVAVHERSEGGVELRPCTTCRKRRRGVDAADPVRDLDELRQLRQPRRNRDRLAREATGPTATVPLLVRGRDRVLYRL